MLPYIPLILRRAFVSYFTERSNLLCRFQTGIDDVCDVLIDANICVAVACIGALRQGCRCGNVPFNGDFSGSFVSGRMSDVEAEWLPAVTVIPDLRWYWHSRVVFNGEIDVGGSDLKIRLPSARVGSHFAVNFIGRYLRQARKRCEWFASIFPAHILAEKCPKST